MEFPGFKLDVTSLRQFQAPEPGFLYDLLIVGGGPAAMSAAIYAARKLIKIAIITKDLGGQMLETGDVENWLGYRRISARELVDNFSDHVATFNLPVAVGAAAQAIVAEKHGFTVTTFDGKVYLCKAIIVCTGKRHRSLDVPGEKEFSGRGVAYCATCDVPFYARKKVVIAGGGNSAFTTAIELLRADATVTMVNFIRGWQADQAMRQRAAASSKMKFLDYHQVAAIEGDDRVRSVRVKNRETGSEKQIEADGIFIEIGLISNTDLLQGLVELNSQGEIMVDCACQTSLPGFFAAGDVTTVPYKQIIISGGEGAKAALAAYGYLFERNLI